MPYLVMCAQAWLLSRSRRAMTHAAPPLRVQAILASEPRCRFGVVATIVAPSTLVGSTWRCGATGARQQRTRDAARGSCRQRPHVRDHDARPPAVVLGGEGGPDDDLADRRGARLVGENGRRSRSPSGPGRSVRRCPIVERGAPEVRRSTTSLSLLGER